jgi:twinkle protein
MSDYDDDEESQFVGREPCPKCGSEDNLARYSDGHAYCFGVTCNHYEPAPRHEGDDDGPRRPVTKSAPSELLRGRYAALTKRHISEETATRFRYQIASFNGTPVQVATYNDWAGNPVAQKLRFADKAEGMPWLGQKKGVALFGAHLFGKSKRIVITEGEIDAMSVAQAFGNKWPAVSIANGADGARKDIANALEYLAGFDEIVLMFDMDDPGRAAVQAAAEVLTGHRVLVASLPFKDANEALVAGKPEVIVQAVYSAKPYVPPAVVHGIDIIERRRNRPKVVSYPYPDWMPNLNKKVLGFRLGELDTWTSGSGMGKTTMLRQLQLHVFNTTPFNQALIMLEEPLETTADEMLAAHIKKRFKLPEVAETLLPGEIERAEEELFLATDAAGNSRFYLHDAFGSMGSDENLMNRIRYYAHACDCKVIWLDHLSILVSDMGEEGDERRRIDSLMHSLKTLTVELGIYIGLVCHLKKAGGNTSFEEGAVPSLDDLRGSGGIKQLSDSVLALSRDQQADSEAARHTAQTHVLKCRYTGDTGPGDFLFYNRLTGCFEQGVDPELAAQFPPVEPEAYGQAEPF